MAMRAMGRGRGTDTTEEDAEASRKASMGCGVAGAVRTCDRSGAKYGLFDAELVSGNEDVGVLINDTPADVQASYGALQFRAFLICLIAGARRIEGRGVD